MFNPKSKCQREPSYIWSTKYVFHFSLENVLRSRFPLITRKLSQCKMEILEETYTKRKSVFPLVVNRVQFLLTGPWAPTVGAQSREKSKNGSFGEAEHAFKFFSARSE